MGANVKAETMKLVEQRTGIETEMNVIIERLSRPGGPGIYGNLLDSEGFPRADIDIPAVRADRHRLAELRNDHVVITEKINQNIQTLHSAKTAPTVASTKLTSEASANGPGFSMNIDSSVSVTSSSTMDIDATLSRPFAMVDEITEASPAAEDGLQLGDQVVKFGSVEYGEDLLQRLAAESQRNQGHAVPMAVLRQGALVNLAVTPRTWEGYGLLGCHFRMI